MNPILDAQVLGGKISPEDSQKISEEKLKIFAKDFAQKNNHHSFSYGSCDDKSKFFISAPSPANLEINLDKKTFNLKKIKVLEYCQHTQVGFAEFENGKIFALNADKKTDDYLIPSQEGWVGISCLPKDSRRGPEEWFLFKNKNETMWDFPFSQDKQITLSDWINQLRKKFGIFPMIMFHSDEMKLIEGLISHNKTMTHQRNLFSETKNKLEKNHIQMQSENRVIGQNNSEMMQILWASPFHRQSLLNRDADMLGLLEQEIDGKKLVVIVLGKKIK